MAVWTFVEGQLADGLPMRLFAAEEGGQLWITSICDDVHPLSEDEFLRRLGNEKNWQHCKNGTGSDALNTATAQCLEYFAGRRLDFDLPLSLRGTPFQVRVWLELVRIPCGQTRSYGEIAGVIGYPSAFRAVGAANGRNHLPLVVPCHRVIASDGKLAGFGGGIGLKKRLLAHEWTVAGFGNR